MYMVYFRTIGLAFIIPIIFLYAFQQAASLGYNYWLQLWADHPMINGSQNKAEHKLAVFGALGFAQGEYSGTMRFWFLTGFCLLLASLTKQQT